MGRARGPRGVGKGEALILRNHGAVTAARAGLP
jgi:hypothetical protein